jgi:predicted nucleotidyltransferase
MISESEKRTIREISKKYAVKRVLLFGSSIAPDKEGRDIDLAVEGIAPEDFFKFYGDLMLKLSKPVDVVDLSGKSKFTRMIKREGLPLYG